MPRRAVVAIVATALGLVLLISFKTPDQPVALGPSRTAVVGNRGTGGGQTANGSLTGAIVQTPFGDVQVQVTKSGGRITDVQALQLPSDRQRSAEISSYAGPILRQEALQAQSAQIDLVSGATYTSDAYQRSLQSALDKAGG